MVLTIFFTVAFLNFILGLLVYMSDRKSIIHKWFGIFGFLSGLWVLSNALLDIFPTVFLIRTVYAIGALVMTSGMFWILQFCGEKINKTKIYLFWILGIVFSITPYISNNFFLVNIRSIYLGGVESNYGPGFVLYSVYMLIVFLVLVYKLILNYIRSEGIERLQRKFVLVGVFTWIFSVSLVTFILPLFGINNFISFDSPTTLIFVVSIAYAITKHHLMNIKVIATELFSILLVIVSAVEMFNTGSLNELIYKIIIFLAVLIFAILLVRSVIQEVRHREKLELLSLQLEKANEHLKELMKMKSEFLAIASHQLRTPLTGVRGLLGMQADGDFDSYPPDKLKQVHQDMLTCVNRLNAIVNDLLDALEVEGGLKLTLKPVQIEPMIDAAIKDLQPNYDKKGLYLKFEKPASPLPKIEAEERYLSQIFMNLIDNAEKYTPTGGVTITAQASGNSVVIRVKDTGIGIKPEDQKKLFEKFTRAEMGARTHAGGSGLGLFIVKKIVAEHQGKIKIESTGVAGQGTTFVVTLPMKQGSKEK